MVIKMKVLPQKTHKSETKDAQYKLNPNTRNLKYEQRAVRLNGGRREGKVRFANPFGSFQASKKENILLGACARKILIFLKASFLI